MRVSKKLGKSARKKKLCYTSHAIQRVRHNLIIKFWLLPSYQELLFFSFKVLYKTPLKLVRCWCFLLFVGFFSRATATDIPSSIYIIPMNDEWMTMYVFTSWANEPPKPNGVAKLPSTCFKHSWSLAQPFQTPSSFLEASKLFVTWRPFLFTVSGSQATVSGSHLGRATTVWWVLAGNAYWTLQEVLMRHLASTSSPCHDHWSLCALSLCFCEYFYALAW
jgi:hypothetical protein